MNSAKVREALKVVGETFTDETEIAPYKSLKLNTYNEYKIIEQAITDYERLLKKETYQNQFKNSRYVVIQDSVAKGFEFDDIREAVDKLYSLKGTHKYDMGVLACVGGEQVFMIAERKLDWSEEK